MPTRSVSNTVLHRLSLWYPLWYLQISQSESRQCEWTYRRRRARLASSSDTQLHWDKDRDCQGNGSWSTCTCTCTSSSCRLSGLYASNSPELAIQSKHLCTTPWKSSQSMITKSKSYMNTHIRQIYNMKIYKWIPRGFGVLGLGKITINWDI